MPDHNHVPFLKAISPFEEMGAYEKLWSDNKSFSKISKILSENYLTGIKDFIRVNEEQGGTLTEQLRKTFENSNHVLGLTAADIKAFNNIPRQLGLAGYEHYRATILETLTQPRYQEILPKISEIVNHHNEVQQAAQKALNTLHSAGIKQFGLRVASEADFPKKILDFSPPPHCLYYQGYWNFMESPSVSVVGTRKPTDEGIKRTKQLVKQLTQDHYTIVSGLAEGIDTVAHEAAIDENGATIAVLGTPLQLQYPARNKALREKIAKDYLVISQFPVSSITKPWFFTERNKLMSAMTEATIIVEAGSTSGTQVQAKAALKQGRKLFILNSCFERNNLTWPHEFEQLGAIRVHDYEDIKNHLPQAA